MHSRQHSLQGKERTDKGMQFKTARAKEYPSPLCALFAETLLTANKREPGQRDQAQDEDLIQKCIELRDKERDLGQQVKIWKDYATKNTKQIINNCYNRS